MRRPRERGRRDHPSNRHRTQEAIMTTPIKRDPSYQFDTQKYLAANADIAAAHINPLEHFLLFGAIESRAANAGGWL
jgi:hypothetical protein